MAANLLIHAHEYVYFQTNSDNRKNQSEVKNPD